MNKSLLSEGSDFRILPKTRRSLYYGGGWHDAISGEVTDVINPATGESLGPVSWAGADDADRAVTSAYDGFLAWRDTAPLERATIMRKAAAAIRAHADQIARIETADSGVPHKRIAPDIEAGAVAFEWFGALATEIKGSTIPVGGKNLNFTVREPLGVIVRISAFNHPFLFATQHAAAAIASGNAVVMKPAEQTPLSTLYLAELIGPLFPPGVVSVLPGGRACGEALVAHRKVAKVGLVGSIPTGKAILAAAAGSMKKVSLELGGKNALIAYPDADIESLVAGIVKGMNFAFLGQSCGSTSRVFLHDQIHDAVLGRVVDTVRTMRFGDPRAPDTEMGCLVSQAQLDKVHHYVDLAMSEGARLVLGGKRPDRPDLANGFYFEPTIFSDVTPQMRIAREEVFGPVLSVLRWRDEDELFSAVNDLDYGLSSSIWTSNIATAHRAAARVEVGYVWINGAGTHYFGAPFGGYKQSGLGREESIEELIDNTQLKNINVSL